MSVWLAAVLTVLFIEACLFGLMFGLTAVFGDGEWSAAWITIAAVHGCAVIGVLVVLPLYWLWNAVVA